MKFSRNEKLILALAVVLTASISPISRTSVSSQDLASESTSSIQACIDRARNGSSEDCEVSKKDVRKRQESVVLKLHIVKNEKNEEKLEGTAVAVVKCSECKIEETSSAIDLRAIPVNDIAKIEEHLQAAKKEATKHFNEAVAERNKELACEVDEDGDEIKDTDTQAKLDCFKRQADKQDDKKKYIAKYVEPFFKDHVEQGIAMQALNGNPYAAHSLVAQWRNLGLGDDALNGKLNLMDTVAQTRIENIIYGSNASRIALQYMPGLSSNDPKVRQAAQQAYNQAMNWGAQNHFARLLNSQAALTNSMGMMSSTDPLMSSLSSGMMMQLNQNVQGMINSNKALATTLGPNFANNNNALLFGNSLYGNSFYGAGYLGNSTVGGNLLGTGLMNDPLALNGNIGLSSLFSTGFGMNSNWQQYPQWGSNFTADSGTAAQATSANSTITPPSATAPVRTSMKNPSLKRM